MRNFKAIPIALFAAFLTILIINVSCKKDEEKDNQAPTCKITAPQDGKEINKGETVTISVDATDSDGSITEVLFFINEVAKGTDNSIPYTFDWTTSSESEGNYVLKATSIDNSGGSKSDEVAVVIVQGAAAAPIADFTASPMSGTVPLTVNFTDQSSNNPTSWQWNFGDGDDASSQNPTKTYTVVGTYTVKLIASNSSGTDTVSKIDYITVEALPNSFTDPRDGQSYQTVDIGTQTWFAENLNYETSDSWCYNNSSNNCSTYGRLYNWLSARTACPDGWHLPSDNEWKQMEMSLGMSQSQADLAGWRGTDEGSKLKSTSGWISNGNGTNSSGFSALAAGTRNTNSTFEFSGLWGLFWTDTQWDNNAIYRLLTYNEDRIRRFNSSKYNGYSVRCIKD